MTRIRKAWSVKPTLSDDVYETFFAPTGSKARYQAFLSWRDCFPDLKIADIWVRRNKWRDVILPPEHRLVSELSPAERHIIEHAYGSNSRDPGYRDHYCAGPAELPLLRLTFELGLFDGPHGRVDEYGLALGWSGQFYYLTDLGKQVAHSMLPEYPR